MDRIELLTSAAHRAATINRAFGSNMSPFEIEQRFAAEDIDLLIMWMDRE